MPNRATPGRRGSVRRRPVQARSRATVAAIVQAAIRILSSEGVERATTNRIAAVAGVSIGTLYQYFATREAVFEAVIDDVLDRVVGAAERASQPGRPIDQILRAIVHAVLGELAGHPEVLRALGALPGTTIRHRIDAARETARRTLVQLFEANPHHVQVRDPVVAARLAVDIGEGVASNLSRHDDIATIADEVTFLVVRWLRREAHAHDPVS